ncbi:MAG: methyltransferase domain-containing protein [Lutibacter sp.]|nr:methyltransferase domain-containing protein [Lutibacter sp.]
MKTHSQFPIKFVCPKCKQSLSYDENKYLCKLCNETYNTDDGMFVFLTNEQKKELSNLITLNENDFIEYHNADSRVHEKEVYESSGYLSRFFSGIIFSSEDTILDLGCGRGHMSEYLLKNTEAKIISQDIVKRALLDTSNPHKLLASADKIPFEDNTFSMVICVDVFEHLPPIMVPDVLMEVYRILKPGGIFYLAFPGNNLPNISGLHVLNIFIRILRLFDKRIGVLETKECAAHINMTYPHIMNKKLKKTGFKGKLHVNTIKFMSLPPKYIFLAKIVNVIPFNYFLNKELTGKLVKPLF